MPTPHPRFLQDLIRNASPGMMPDLTQEEVARWIERATLPQLGLLLTRHLIMAGWPPAEVMAVLDVVLESASGRDANEALLLKGNLQRDDGDDAGAYESYVRAFSSMGWPEPSTVSYLVGAKLRLGIRSSLSAGNVVVLDNFRGNDVCSIVRAEIDDLDGHGWLHSGGFHDQAHDTRSQLQCNKRQGDLFAIVLRHGVELPGITTVTSAMHRVVLGNNYFEGTVYHPLEFQIAAYDGNAAVYGAHTDRTPEGLLHRELTLIYYANPNWKPEDGGVLRVKTALAWREIEPLGDRLVAFPSECLHEVVPSYQSRRSLTCWCWVRSDRSDEQT